MLSAAFSVKSRGYLASSLCKHVEVMQNALTQVASHVLCSEPTGCLLSSNGASVQCGIRISHSIKGLKVTTYADETTAHQQHVSWSYAIHADTGITSGQGGRNERQLKGCVLFYTFLKHMGCIGQVLPIIACCGLLLIAGCWL